MILQMILDALKAMFLPLFDVLPSLPSMPADVSSALTAIGTYIIQGAQLIKYIFGSTFITAYFGAILVLINFDRAYDFLFWVLRKIPMVNIKQ